MDITLSREMTINTGNFENIKPGVTVTLKDVDADMYEKISNVVDSMIGLEIIKLLDENQSIKSMGMNEYFTHLISCKDVMEKEIIDFIEETNNDDGF